MKKLLIVVDYQNDFVNGALPCGEMAERLERPIADRIKAFLAAGHDVLFLKDTHDKNTYASTRESGSFPPHCLKGTDGWELYGAVRDLAAGRAVLEKPAFGAATLPAHPLVKAADEYELCGVATNVCVLHNAVILHDFFVDKPVRVYQDLCASFDRRLHENALEIMQGFGVELI